MGSKLEAVVYVPGIFLGSGSMWMLHKRLERCGFSGRRFGYASTRNTAADSAARLQEFVEGVDAQVVHFVCHSLGGLLVRHLFHGFPEQRPGRVVTLGTPHQGSCVARRLAQLSPLKRLLGTSLETGLTAPAPEWPAERALGVIAGTLPVGAGSVVPGLPSPSDGTVAVAETGLPGMAGRALLPVTHTGLLTAASVARLVCAFLRTGIFPELTRLQCIRCGRR
jgi:pimeloyl-ACP methyl ester carboxylesterase